MKFLDPDDPFFRKAWVRWITVLTPLFWAGVEFFYGGNPGWGLIFLAAGAYAGWMLFVKRKGS
jgi:hypothetical protein